MRSCCRTATGVAEIAETALTSRSAIFSIFLHFSPAAKMVAPLIGDRQAVAADIVMRATLHHRAIEHLIRAMAAHVFRGKAAGSGGPLPNKPRRCQPLSTGFGRPRPRAGLSRASSKSGALQHEPAEVRVLGQRAHVLAHVGGVDADLRAGLVGGGEADLLEQLL